MELLRAIDYELILKLYRLNLQGLSKVARAEFVDLVRRIIWTFNFDGLWRRQFKTRASRALACIGRALNDAQTSPDMPIKSADKVRLLSEPQVAVDCWSLAQAVQDASAQSSSLAPSSATSATACRRGASGSAHREAPHGPWHRCAHGGLPAQSPHTELSHAEKRSSWGNCKWPPWKSHSRCGRFSTPSCRATTSSTSTRATSAILVSLIASCRLNAAIGACELRRRRTMLVPGRPSRSAHLRLCRVCLRSATAGRHLTSDTMLPF